MRPIRYNESKGSAQCKSSIIFGGMRTEGKTVIKAKKSRNHTELMCKYLNLPIKVKNKKNYDLIEISKIHNIRKFNYKIPSDISSAAFFMVLTVLTKNSKITIKNVNIILIIFTTTFMIRKSLVGAETKTAESTAIVESVWEMF